MQSNTVLQFYQIYKNLLLQTSLSISLTLIINFLKLPIFFLQGLNTYIHPENIGQKNAQRGPRAAIARPSSKNPEIEGYKYLSKPDAEVKKKSKSKEKFEFDENNAQIFRIKLDEGHLESRLYYGEYRSFFVSSVIAISCFLLLKYLGVSEDRGVLGNGSLVPLLFGFVAFSKVCVSLVKISIEKSASKRFEKTLSLFLGGLGFTMGIVYCLGIVSCGLDFEFGRIDGVGSFLVSSLMGCFVWFLYMPAGRSARSFWLGTDQIRCNLSIISCGWFGRMILYANYLVSVVTALLWINPFTDLLVNKNGSNGNMGMLLSEFRQLRVWFLLLSGILQVMAVRPNLQMFLNEAVLSWYQRLHASKVPDLEFSRVKIFLHNHYLCLAVIQFLGTPLLVLLFLGFSQVEYSAMKELHSVCDSSCFGFVREVALFMSWWVVSVWTVFTSANILFYRRGILYVS